MLEADCRILMTQHLAGQLQSSDDFLRMNRQVKHSAVGLAVVELVLMEVAVRSKRIGPVLGILSAAAIFRQDHSVASSAIGPRIAKSGHSHLCCALVVLAVPDEDPPWCSCTVSVLFFLALSLRCDKMSSVSVCVEKKVVLLRVMRWTQSFCAQPRSQPRRRSNPRFSIRRPNSSFQDSHWQGDSGIGVSSEGSALTRDRIIKAGGKWGDFFEDRKG